MRGLGPNASRLLHTRCPKPWPLQCYEAPQTTVVVVPTWPFLRVRALQCKPVGEILHLPPLAGWRAGSPASPAHRSQVGCCGPKHAGAQGTLAPRGRKGGFEAVVNRMNGSGLSFGDVHEPVTRHLELHDYLARETPACVVTSGEEMPCPEFDRPSSPSTASSDRPAVILPRECSVRRGGVSGRKVKPPPRGPSGALTPRNWRENPRAVTVTLEMPGPENNAAVASFVFTYVQCVRGGSIGLD